MSIICSQKCINLEKNAEYISDQSSLNVANAFEIFEG